MNEINLGKLCPLSSECPVYGGILQVEQISPLLIKNVFCNRGYKGWKNCKRYKLAEEQLDVPATATPYKLV